MAHFRRAYVYLICAISLTIVAVGLVNVLEIGILHLWNAITGSNLFNATGEEIRRRLSLNLALAGVALPVLLFHARLAERWSSGTSEESDRTSFLRSLYFTGVLAISLLIAGTSLSTLVDNGLSRLLDDRYFVNARDGVMIAMTALVAGGIWLGHAWLRRRDMRVVEIPNQSAWPIRAYLYGALAISAIMLLSGAAELLSIMVDSAVNQGTGFFNFSWFDELAAPAIARLLVGALIWGIHWSHSLRLLRDAGWAGAGERFSTIRRTYLYVLLLIGVIASFVAATAVLSELVESLTAGRGPELESLLQPVAIAAPFTLLWIYHLHRVRLEFGEFTGSEGRVTANRVHGYLVGFVGLVMGSIGLGYLAGVTVEMMFDAVSLAEGGTIWRDNEGSVFVGMVIVGATAWSAYWLPAQRMLAASPGTERRSPIRRAYLYLALAFSTLALLAAVATLLYQFLQIAMGVSTFSGMSSDLPVLLGVVLIAALTVAYHLRCLLADLREDTERSLLVTEDMPLVPLVPSRLTLVLESQDASALEAIASSYREDRTGSVSVVSAEIVTGKFAQGDEPDIPDDPGQNDVGQPSEDTPTDSVPLSPRIIN